MKIIKTELVTLFSKKGKKYPVIRMTLENGVTFEIFPTFCGKWPEV